jgi:hypothetical protein
MNILVATDGSESAIDAARRSIELLRPEAHVVPNGPQCAPVDRAEGAPWHRFRPFRRPIRAGSRSTVGVASGVKVWR